MSIQSNVRDVQMKILDIIKYIDKVCRENNIVYYIMGGTALGAIRHGGFIPWDDDLDIFMTPNEYAKFKVAFSKLNQDKFVLQEWKTTEKYLEYAKVRMNGTTFIEENFKDRKDIHQGIYVDIMILHQVSTSKILQKIVYFESKFVTLYGILQRNWKPKSKKQQLVVTFMNFLPCKFLVHQFYKRIYKYDGLQGNYMYCYWITPANFKSGLFPRAFFENPIDIQFEDTKLMGASNIKEYLTTRYGNYMCLPSKEQQKAAVHAMIFDTNKDYTEYIK